MIRSVMGVATGHRLGPYEIVGFVGAGGMGEVHRARDTRLGREVAIKVLPIAVSGSADRVRRFEQEARLAGSLNHPNILTVFDVGLHEGAPFLVTELLSGHSLADVLRRGPLPTRRAVEYAVQGACGLAAAHDHGVVHRDIKPANLFVTDDGRVKILDFGLAKLVVPEPANGTQTTEDGGWFAGTPGYTAPEQLRGEPVDARADVFALGAVLFEMLSGRRAFDGTSAADRISAILNRDVGELGGPGLSVPPALERVVRRCLEKDPRERFQSARDVGFALQALSGEPQGATVAPTAARRPLRGRRAVLGAGALALALLGAGGWLASVVTRQPGTTQPVVRSLLEVGPAAGVDSGGDPTPGGLRTAFSWTVDGRALAFIGRGPKRLQVFVRELDRDEARALEGTGGARALATSPDGRSVVFWADGAIRRSPLRGGPPTVVAKVPVPPSAIASLSNGEVVYDANQTLWRAAAEAAPVAVSSRPPGGAESHILPALLPGEKALLYTVRDRVWTWGQEQLVVHVLATGERKVLLRDAADGRYLATGHLLFMRRGTLFAVEFDVSRLEIRGRPVAVLDGVAQTLAAHWGDDMTGAGQWAVSSAGALAYLTGAPPSQAFNTVAVVDRAGRVTPLSIAQRHYVMLDVDASARFAAVLTKSVTEQAVWLLDLQRKTLDRITPPDGEAFAPRLTPDGERVAYRWRSGGRQWVALQRTDGTTPPEAVAGADGIATSFSRDGRQLAFVRDWDIWVKDLGGDGAARQVTQTADTEAWPEFSPDGRWLAYGSNVTGRFEVYVQPWPGPGARRQVSLGGGGTPAWNPTGGELLYVRPARPGDPADASEMMAVDVATTPQLRIGATRRLFRLPPRTGWWAMPMRLYRLAPDGKRFFVTLDPEPPPAPPPVLHVRLVQNWTDELRARLAEAAR